MTSQIIDNSRLIMAYTYRLITSHVFAPYC